MSVLATETFTAANNTVISSRACDTGQTWTKAADSDASNITIVSSQAQLSALTSTAFSRYLLNVSLGSADYTISGTLKTITATNSTIAALLLRSNNANPGSQYRIRRDTGTFEWHIERTVGSTDTVLVTTVGVPSSGTNDINVSFSVSGVGATVALSATIAVPSFSFTQTITFNDTDATRIVSTGLPGIGLYEAVTTPLHAWDSLEVDGTAAGSVLKGYYYALTQGIL